MQVAGDENTTAGRWGRRKVQKGDAGARRSSCRGAWRHSEEVEEGRGALVDHEGDGEVRWCGTKGSKEEVGRRDLAVEAARGSGAGSSSPWLDVCVCVSGGGVGGREGEIERRGLG